MTKDEFRQAVREALPENWRELSEKDLATDIWPVVEKALKGAKRLLFEVAFEDPPWTFETEESWYARVRTLFPDIDKESAD